MRDTLNTPDNEKTFKTICEQLLLQGVLENELKLLESLIFVEDGVAYESAMDGAIASVESDRFVETKGERDRQEQLKKVSDVLDELDRSLYEW